MRYVLLIYSLPQPPGDAATVEEWQEFDKLVTEAGIEVTSESMQDRTTATSVRVSGSGDRTVTDGPVAEAGAALGGFHVIDVPDLDVALDWAARCPGAHGGGAVEVRPVEDRG